MMQHLLVSIAQCWFGKFTSSARWGAALTEYHPCSTAIHDALTLFNPGPNTLVNHEKCWTCMYFSSRESHWCLHRCLHRGICLTRSQLLHRVLKVIILHFLLLGALVGLGCTSSLFNWQKIMKFVVIAANETTYLTRRYLAILHLSWRIRQVNCHWLLYCHGGVPRALAALVAGTARVLAL